MPDLELSVYITVGVIGALFVLLIILWCLLTYFFYMAGKFHYWRHTQRRTRKKDIRAQEEAHRKWKRKHDSDWINYQFRLQTSLINAKKVPGNWPPDQVTPPCSPPPEVDKLPGGSDDDRYEDNVPWMKPPGFCSYWCNKDKHFIKDKERYDNQHITMDKTKGEYAEWKRKYDEDLQRTIKNHPIASVFLNLSKNPHE